MADSSEFRFRELRLPGDEHALLALLRLGFPETAGKPENSAEFLAWKFSRDADQPLSELGFDRDGRLVSFYGVIPMDYVVAGERRTLGLVCDVMSHPEVRRRGLFVAAGRSAMRRLEAATVDAVTGYPIRADVMPGHLKVGWTVHFRLPVYLAATGASVPGSLARSIAVRAGALLPHLPAATRGAVREVDVEELAIVASGLAASLAARGTAIAVRDAPFLHWRLARPGASYLAVVAEGGRGTACAIARETVLRDIPALALLDIASDDRGATRAALRWLRLRARRAGLPVVAFCANAGTARQLGLGSAGFVRSPLTFRLIARPTGPNLAASAFGRDAEWHLTWLDSDTV